MTDLEFLQCVDNVLAAPTGARTLVSREELARLLTLAGEHAGPVVNGSRKLYTLARDELAPLVARARARMAALQTAAEARVESKRMAARAYQVVADRALDSHS